MSSVITESSYTNNNAAYSVPTGLSLKLQDSLVLGNVEQLKAAIAAGADVNQTLPCGEIPIALAHRLNNQQMIDLLIKGGAQEPSPTDDKVKFFMKWMGIDLLVTAASMGANIVATSSKICIHNYMSHSLANSIQVHNQIHELIRTSVTDNMFLKMTVVGPALEEVECRLIIQEILLKQLPKKILKTFAPDYVDLVDSKIAKVSRVVISSLLFALPHYVPPLYVGYMVPGASGDPTMTCLIGNRVINAFGGGLVLGAIQEITGDIRYSTVAHMLHNFVPALVSTIR